MSFWKKNNHGQTEQRALCKCRGDGDEVFDTAHDGKRNTDRGHGYEIIAA
jgi:hypothetical protein